MDDPFASVLDQRHLHRGCWAMRCRVPL